MTTSNKRSEVSPKVKATRQSALSLNVSPYSSSKESKFGLSAKIKLFKDNHTKGKVKYRIDAIEKREKTTASETFKTTLQKSIGSGTLKTNMGVAKKKALIDNASADNLRIRDKENSRMLARQIASWKVARNLNLRVLSNEKYALGEDNEILGVSAMLPETAKSIFDIMDEQKEIMDAASLNTDQMKNYLGNVVFSGKIQKELSDLQLIDALVGQTDRHYGNIYVDIENQRVYGIDNDQAFGSDPMYLNAQNAVRSFKVYDKDPEKFKSIRSFDEERGIEFTQNQIDINSAEKVLAMSEENLENILRDKVGEAHGEYLLPEEIDMAKMRLRAIKQQILRLKAANKLIRNWDGTTYNDSLTTYGELAKITEGADVFQYNNSKFGNIKFQNYIAREVSIKVHGTDQSGYVFDNVRKTGLATAKMMQDFGITK